ncbi:hypothetical protein D3C78_1353890 [compost metagenome]
MARLLVQPPPMETRAPGHRGHFIPVEKPGSGADLIVGLDLAFQLLHRTFMRRAHHITPLHPFAVDLVIADHL